MPNQVCIAQHLCLRWLTASLVQLIYPSAASSSLLISFQHSDLQPCQTLSSPKSTPRSPSPQLGRHRTHSQPHVKKWRTCAIIIKRRPRTLTTPGRTTSSISQTRRVSAPLAQHNAQEIVPWAKTLCWSYTSPPTALLHRAHALPLHLY
jgi:hypothetical protein